MKRFLSALPILFTTASLFAQRTTPTVRPSYSPSAEDAAGGCLACGTCAGGGVVGVIIMVVIVGGLIALSIALLVWVARDAKNRGMDNAVMWMILVFFTNVLGLIIYIFSRPQGNLVPCPSCKNKRLEASAKCPHCGNP